eukprot:jgi/Tetstr1/449406/TSEL_036501.t1
MLDVGRPQAGPDQQPHPALPREAPCRSAIMKELFKVPSDHLGEGRARFAWSPRGQYMAAVGTHRKVNIYDRNGKLVNEIMLPAEEAVEEVVEDKRRRKRGAAAAGGRGSDPEEPCALLQWDVSGKKLAVLPARCSVCVIWIAKTMEVVKLDTNWKNQELTWMQWSKKNDILAIGTSKGNLMLYNDNEKKKVPITGKHTKSITCGQWNVENLLAMGGDDATLTVTDGLDGDTIKTVALKAEPHEVIFSSKKETDSRGQSAESTISINVGQQSIYLMSPNDTEETPIELAFQEMYGNILRHAWYGDGYIVIGFQSGQVVIVSTHNAELSEEVHSQAYLPSNLVDLAVCPSAMRAAIAGNRTVKVIELGTGFKEMTEDAIEMQGSTIESLKYTDDGSVLTIATTAGGILSYLATLPVVHASFMTRVAYLTSLQEISVVDVLSGNKQPVQIETEPSFLGLGPNHVAVGMNNQAWFYRCEAEGTGSTIQVNTRDYMGSVGQVYMTERYAAVLSDGSVTVHAIEPSDYGEEDEWQVPGKGHQADVTAMGVTEHFLVTGTARGSIVYHLLEGRGTVNEFRHEDGGITRLFPQPHGTRLVFEDTTHQVHLYNPVNDQVLSVPGFNGVMDSMLWDCADSNVFAIFDSSNIHCYVYHPVTINGPTITELCVQPKGAGLSPIVLNNGQLTGQLKNGSLEVVPLESHRGLQEAALRAGGAQAARKRFDALLAIGDLKAAWEAAIAIKSKEAWGLLCDAAMRAMDLELAIWVFRHQGDASMVMSLERIRHVEDKNLLAGHILVLKEGDYDTAQELFLRSSYPLAALEMRKDLKHWDQAMKLAEQLDPGSIGAISRQYAGMLEVKGDFPAALDYYQQAQDLCAEDPVIEGASQAGTARCSLHMGDIRRGRQIALARNEAALFRECASILEGLNQMQDAAEMYERGGLFERAATIYIQNKSFAAVAPLMAKISSPKLHLQYAKAKEGEGKYAEAAAAYEAANDMDSVARLNLEKLKNPHKAFAVVRKTHSSEGASMVANFCLSNGDFQSAIEFLLLAKRNEEAFDFAQTHNAMDAYVKFAGSSVSMDEWVRVARYYETSGKHNKAGDMWTKCGQYDQALRAYMRGDADSLDKAINMVGKANNPSLTNQLVDFLMGETDGEAKDHNYLFKLHMALGDYEQAAQTSVLIAKQEQEMGNYKVAHGQLLATYRELQRQKKRTPAELTRSLMLLHSYILVKILARSGDHQGAARMLMRVARNISKFPEHVVPILTSTVIECQRAGFKKTAFEYASMLVRPEYRQQLRPEYKRKIENMVRKPDREAEDDEEASWPCPFLPHAGAGHRAGDFVKILMAEKACPMCAAPVSLNEVAKMEDPVAVLKQQEAAVAAAAAAGEGDGDAPEE